MSVVAELMDVARRHGCSAYYVDDGIWITTVGDLGHRAEWVLANEAEHGRLNTINAPIGQLATLLDRILGVLRDPDFRHALKAAVDRITHVRETARRRAVERERTHVQPYRGD